MRQALMLAAVAALAACTTQSQAPAPAAAPAAPVSALKREMVGRADVSVPGREAVIARVEVAPGGKAGRHTHPGDEISYILEGESLLLIDGQPPRRVKAGESFVIPAGVVHDAHNDSGKPVKLVGVYVVEKGKPLATPAP
ncbi:cupin domain-containing protein [Ramlibacter sp. PS4R-6]|uniref:cupin domain-containing protein n=1 Tax=Ramlibacter sp. PS4R-6 TaxID=3133438 RepID=UPI0030A924D2